MTTQPQAGIEPFPFTQFPSTDAATFVQWKGTTVCIDVRCPCGALGHYDGDYASFVQCAHCGAVYELGTAVAARKIAAADAAMEPRLLDRDDD